MSDLHTYRIDFRLNFELLQMEFVAATSRDEAMLILERSKASLGNIDIIQCVTDDLTPALKEAVDFINNGTPIYPGSDVANALKAAFSDRMDEISKIYSVREALQRAIKWIGLLEEWRSEAEQRCDMEKESQYKNNIRAANSAFGDNARQALHALEAEK